MNLGLHPIVLAAIVGILLAIVAAIFAFRARSRAGKVSLSLLTLVMLLPAGLVLVGLNPWLVDDRFRAYRGFYKDIEIGMTRKEVIELMQRHYPSGGPRGAPKVMEDSSSRLGFFMNPETSREPSRRIGSQTSATLRTRPTAFPP